MPKRHTNKNVQKIQHELKTNPAYEKLFPKIDANYRELRESIRDNGHRNPITTNQDRVVLDGHQRLRACIELGIKPWYKVRSFEGEAEGIAHIINSNAASRNLNDFQKIEQGLYLKRIEEKKAKKRMAAAGIQNLPNASSSRRASRGQTTTAKGRSHELAAKLIHVKSKTFQRGEDLIKYGSPEMLERLRKGTITIYGAHKLLRKGGRDKGMASERGNDVAGQQSAVAEAAAVSKVTHKQTEKEPGNLQEVQELRAKVESLEKAGKEKDAEAERLKKELSSMPKNVKESDEYQELLQEKEGLEAQRDAFLDEIEKLKGPLIFENRPPAPGENRDRFGMFAGRAIFRKRSTTIYFRRDPVESNKVLDWYTNIDLLERPKNNFP